MMRQMLKDFRKKRGNIIHLKVGEITKWLRGLQPVGNIVLSLQVVHRAECLSPFVVAPPRTPTVPTAKKLIGKRLSQLKSAFLFSKNIISSVGIFLATHSMLLYIVDSKKCFPTILMGENP
jgi:hypothetical protein